MKESDTMKPNNFSMPYGMARHINNDTRFVGTPFLAPFLLGGITGGFLEQAFYPRPIYGPYPVYRPYPVPYYQNNYNFTSY